MNRIYDDTKIDIGHVSQTLATTTSIGEYYKADEYRTIAFPVSTASMADGHTIDLQVVQAQSSTGTGVKNVTGATATITGNVKVIKAKITLASFTAGSVIVINGLTFTGHASTTTPANREFDISGTDTEDAAELVSLIKDPTYGVPGITATYTAGVITLSQIVPGLETISVTGVATIGVASTIMALGYVEIESDQLDVDNGYNYVAISITTSASLLINSLCLRNRTRYTPTQSFSAEKLGV